MNKYILMIGLVITSTLAHAGDGDRVSSLSGGTIKLLQDVRISKFQSLTPFGDSGCHLTLKRPANSDMCIPAGTTFKVYGSGLKATLNTYSHTVAAISCFFYGEYGDFETLNYVNEIGVFTNALRDFIEIVPPKP